jgi:hypothetical protein
LFSLPRIPSLIWIGLASSHRGFALSQWREIDLDSVFLHKPELYWRGWLQRLVSTGRPWRSDMSLRLLGIAVLMLGVASVHKSLAASPVLLPAYPLYCAGPLTTKPRSFKTVFSTSSSTNTAFRWALSGAGTANPGPGQCAWADRRARGGEIVSAGGNVICDFSGEMTSIPAGIFIEVGVTRDASNNCMHLTHYVSQVSPPFSASAGLPPFTRQGIASLTPQQIASLRHGIQVMMARAPSDPTSYRFQANIHGTDDNATTPAEMQAWNQCQHQGFYFLAWHRMYLYFFDRILRAAAQDPGLVLPYWDWSDPAQRTLPLAFREPADSSNPLFIASSPYGRPAGFNSGTSHLDNMAVDDSTAFADLEFEKDGSLGNGFGGQVTVLQQFGQSIQEGDLENRPHDTVHTELGGSEVIGGVQVTGLMGNIKLAAQDPIFFLHHANIDRLWNKWLAEGHGRANPEDSAWLNSRFTFYDEGGRPVFLTGSQIVNAVGQLNYRYDTEPRPPLYIHKVSTHLAHFANEPSHNVGRRVLATSQHNSQGVVIAESKAEDADARLVMGVTPIRVALPLSETTRAMMRSLPQDPARHWYLRISDIRTSESPGFYYAIYVDPPEGVPLDAHSRGFVGTLSFFSMRPHKMAGGRLMSNASVSTQYNISALIGALITRNLAETTVVLVPRGPVDSHGDQLPLPSAPITTAGKIQLLRY